MEKWVDRGPNRPPWVNMDGVGCTAEPEVTFLPFSGVVEFRLAVCLLVVHLGVRMQRSSGLDFISLLLLPRPLALFSSHRRSREGCL